MFTVQRTTLVVILTALSYFAYFLGEKKDDETLQSKAVIELIDRSILERTMLIRDKANTASKEKIVDSIVDSLIGRQAELTKLKSIEDEQAKLKNEHPGLYKLQEVSSAPNYRNFTLILGLLGSLLSYMGISAYKASHDKKEQLVTKLTEFCDFQLDRTPLSVTQGRSI